MSSIVRSIHAPSMRDGAPADAPAASAASVVRPALRLAEPRAGKPPADAFWREYHRRRSMNHVALMLSARAVQAALDANEAVDDGARRRLRVALEEYESVQRSLRERVGAVAGRDA